MRRSGTSFNPRPLKRAGDTVLGVRQGTQQEDIKTAYRRLASEHHPDKGGDPARMAEINEAYREATEG